MEFNALVDTSLNLNTEPLALRIFEDKVKQEVQSNLIDFRRKIDPGKDEASDLLEELNRVSAENQKLTEMLTIVCENYNALRKQVTEYMSKNGVEINSNGSRKRKSESPINNNNNNNNNGINDNMVVAARACESSSSDEDSCKRPKEEHVKTQISRVYVRTESSNTGMIVKDGYQWRKYGQKVTRDNPSPRAYFKCSYAPTCPVKKKVQRSAEDQSILVATYEGEHNHPHPTKLEATTTSTAASRCVTTLGSVPCSATHASSATITLDLTKPKPNDNEVKNREPKINSPELNQFLVEQMASSLTKDPSFRAALAAAISGRIMLPNQKEKW